MRSIVPMSVFLLGSLTLVPMFAFAEATTVKAGASLDASGALKAPDAPQVSGYSFGASNPGSMSSGGGHNTGRESASGTRPVPKAIEERMQERDVMHEKLVGSSTEHRGEMRQNITKERVELFSHFSATIIARMDAAINRLKKIADRLDSRITKEKARGVDTTKAEASVAIARVKMADAETAVTLAANIVSSTTVSIDLNSTTARPSDIGKPVRETLAKARESIFAAHKALVDAIVSLSGDVSSSGDEHGEIKIHNKGGASTTVAASSSTSLTHDR